MLLEMVLQLLILRLVMIQKLTHTTKSKPTTMAIQKSRKNVSLQSHFMPLI